MDDSQGSSADKCLISHIPQAAEMLRNTAEYREVCAQFRLNRFTLLQVSLSCRAITTEVKEYSCKKGYELYESDNLSLQINSVIVSITNPKAINKI